MQSIALSVMPLWVILGRVVGIMRNVFAVGLVGWRYFAADSVWLIIAHTVPLFRKGKIGWHALQAKRGLNKMATGMTLNELVTEAHINAIDKGFWAASQNMSEKLMLVVTEVAEAMEASRINDVAGFAEEMADVVIRVADLCGFLGIDLDTEVRSKMAKNRERPHMHGKRV